MACRLQSGLSLGEREPGMIQKYSACGSEFDTTGSAQEKCRAHLILKVADLSAQGGLSCVQLLFGSKFQTS